MYSGIDPSADSLHVGNLLPLLALLHFQTSGHQPIALIGGATGSIGDPSGRSSERPILSTEDLERNIKGITNQVYRFFERGMAYVDSRKGGYRLFGTRRKNVKVLNNLEWFKDELFLDFLRTTGKLAKVNVMLARDSVKNRLESGISFTEFSYQLLQAHDYAWLHKHHSCRIQLGGSDQWGNIVAGIDLIKRQQAIARGETVEPDGPIPEGMGDPAYGLTIPLLTTASGEKFGKSAGNAVWLDETKTSVTDFYQFFVRTADADVERYLHLFTFLPLKEIHDIMRAHEANPKIREAQKVLASEVTELVHGPQGVSLSEGTTQLLYQRNVRSWKKDEVLQAFEGDGRLHRVKWANVKDVPITKMMVVYGLVKSRAEATRAVTDRAAHFNEYTANDPRQKVVRSALVDRSILVLRFGSRNHVILYIEDAFPDKKGAGSKGQSGEEDGDEDE